MDSSRIHILIVEDESAHTEAIGRAFQTAKLNAEVQVADTLQEYREAIAASQPDIVIMDMELPDGKAVEVLSFPPESKLFPVVVMTSYGNEQVAVDAMKAGALDYVVKSPATFTGMPATVERCMREWKLLLEKKHSEQQWSSTFEAINNPIWLVDSDGRIINHNKASERLLNKTSKELDGHLCYEVVCNVSQSPGSHPFVRMIETRHRESDIIPLDSQWLEISVDPILDAAGRLLGAVHIVTDITEQKRAREALCESEERYRRITAMVTDYIFTVFIENGQAGQTVHGPTCIAVTGYSAEEFAADPNLWITMVLPEDREFVKNYASCILSDTDPGAIEHRIRRKDDAVRWVHKTLVPHRDSFGALISYDGIICDITERKRAEEDLLQSVQQLQETRDMLIQFEKEAAVGRLAAGVAHELLNPVSIISSGLQFLEEEILTESAKKDLLICRTQIQRIVKIIRDLYQSFAKKQELPLDGDLRHVIEVGLKMTEHRIREDRVQIEYTPPSEVIPVKMDIDRLVKVIVQLILNACDALLQTDQKRLILTIQHPIATGKSSSILLIVSDNGCGIFAGNMNNIFDLFFTTKDPGKGTGLGLSICKNIILEHGGKIHVEKNELGGASFIVELPLSCNATQ